MNFFRYVIEFCEKERRMGERGMVQRGGERSKT